MTEDKKDTYLHYRHKLVHRLQREYHTEDRYDNIRESLTKYGYWTLGRAEGRAELLETIIDELDKANGLPFQESISDISMSRSL